MGVVAPITRARRVTGCTQRVRRPRRPRSPDPARSVRRSRACRAPDGVSSTSLTGSNSIGWNSYASRFPTAGRRVDARGHDDAESGRVVRRQRREPGLGDRRQIHQFGDPGPADVRLQDRGGTAYQPRAELLPVPQALTDRHRGIDPSSHFRMTRHVFEADRCLQEPGAHAVQAATQSDRVRDVVHAVDVDCDQQVVVDGAQGFDSRQVGPHAVPEAELHLPNALCHPVPCVRRPARCPSCQAGRTRTSVRRRAGLLRATGAPARPVIRPARSHSATSTAATASPWCPPRWPRSRMRARSAARPTGAPWSGRLPSKAGFSRSSMILAGTSGATGARASPQPTEPSSAVSFTSSASRAEA